MGGGGGKTTTEVQKSDPWWGQQPYLQDAFGEAQSIYNKQKKQNNPGYTGDFVSQATPDQVNYFKDAMNWSSPTGQGGQMLNTTVNAANQQLGEGQKYLTQAQQGLTDFQGKDWTQQHIDDANRYSQNPMFEAMTDASMRDAKRQFSEETMRGIDQEAARGGNINSTRAGIAAGVAQRGLSEKAADISAGLRGNAWQQGLTASQNDQGALLQAILGQGQMAQGQVAQGFSGLQQGTDMKQKMTDMGVLSQTMLTGFDQARLDNDISKFEYKQAKPWSNLQNYWGIVGDKSWGGTTTGISKTKETPSTMSQIGTGAAILGSLFRCDARVKNILATAGHTKDGLPLYLITYKGLPHLGMHITPMAQDVQAKHPAAVKEIHGVLHIDTNVYDWR